MDKYRKCKRLLVLLLTAALLSGFPGHALAEEGSSGVISKEEAAGTGEEDNGVTGGGEFGSTGGESAGATSTETGTSSAADIPDGKDTPDDDDTPGSLSIDGYEIYAVGGSRDTPDTVRKGRQVKLLVHVKSQGLKTKDVNKSSISAIKLNDSFKITGSPKVKVTSEKEDDLEFTVTFSKITYLGKGNSIRFRTSFKNAGIPSEVLETFITECEESYPRENGDKGDTTGQPVIKVRRISPQAPVGSGDHFSLELDMENTSSDADIEDMVISVNPGTSMFLGDDTNSRIISRLDTKKTASVKFNLIAGTEISGPTQMIDLELKYNYYSGGNLVAGTSIQKVLIPVKGGSASGQPVIRVSRGQIGRSIHSGEAFQLMLNLQNASTDKDIRNLSVTFESNEQISLLEETDTRQLGELRAGQSIDVPVRLQAGAELSTAASQLLGMNLKFDYDSDKGAVQGTYSEKIVIPTSGQTKGPGGPTPNIIVANYTYGERVTAGQVFNLEMEFMNTSRTSPVENVVLSLDTGEGISINSSSNTFFIPALKPGETRKETVKVQALFQSKLQSPKIGIACKYEYLDKKERKQSSSTETIAIPVYQPDRFQVKEPGFTDVIRQGEELTISIPYVNKGRGQVFNVEARLEGDINVLERELSLGNFEAGKSGTIDFVVTPKSEGEFKSQVTVTYEDETMEIKTVQVPIHFDVKEAAADPGDMTEYTEPESGAGRWRIAIWIAVTAAGIGTVVVIIKVKRNKKKGRDEEEQTDGWDEMEDTDSEETFLLEDGDRKMPEPVDEQEDET